MSKDLYGMFEEMFPPINDARRVFGYPFKDDGSAAGFQRVYLNIMTPLFVGITEALVTIPEIEAIANNVFNGLNFETKDVSNVNCPEIYAISFLSSKLNNWYKKFDNHSINFNSFRHPNFYFSTGNRGSIDLHPTQRQMYYDFARKVYGLFVEKAEKLKGQLFFNFFKDV